jgi:hypothetical protein
LGIDGIGTNCGISPTRNLSIVQALAKLTDLPITAFPNLGYAQYVDGRFVYLGEPDEFAQLGEDLWQAGANLIGGCCGTTPEHIRLLAERLRTKAPQPRIARRIEVKPEEQPKLKSPMPNFLGKLWREPIVIVELDPPRGLDYEPILEGAKLVGAGRRGRNQPRRQLLSVGSAEQFGDGVFDATGSGHPDHLPFRWARPQPHRGAIAVDGDGGVGHPRCLGGDGRPSPLSARCRRQQRL